MKALNRDILVFLVGLFIGAAALTVRYYFELAPPAPQETKRIEVEVGKLNSADQWLAGARFQVVPIDEIESRRKYAVLVITPPSDGLHAKAGTAAWLNLAETDLVQPIQIYAQDFGSKGDQVVIKFIDEGVVLTQSYSSSQQLSISSP